MSDNTVVYMMWVFVQAKVGSKFPLHEVNSHINYQRVFNIQLDTSLHVKILSTEKVNQHKMINLSFVLRGLLHHIHTAWPPSGDGTSS